MKNLLKISQVSKKYKTTNRQLRFYEEKGLLSPAFIDENNGYRYYSEESCRQLEKILCLKEMGFSLLDISVYLTANEYEKKSLILKYDKNAQQKNTTLAHIIYNGDYNLSFANDIRYTGNDIKNKDLAKLKGVWVLKGAYNNIKDAVGQNDVIDGFSPYKFLAFDENGNSPWFYMANTKKIIFDAMYKPCSETYQIRSNCLYLKISNYQQHIFANVGNSIQMPHILVFEKFSDAYEDYQKFIHEDEVISSFVTDSELIGVWKNEFNQYLIVEKDGVAFMSSVTGNKKLVWTKGVFYEDALNARLHYTIKNNILNLEKKTKIYTFCGVNSGYTQFHKIEF